MLASVALVLPPKHMRTLGLLTLPFCLAVAACLVFIQRINELAAEYRLWSERYVFLATSPIPILNLLIVFTCFILIPRAVKRADPDHPPDQELQLLHHVFRCGLGAIIIGAPVAYYYMAASMVDHVYTSLFFKFNQFTTTPAVCGYLQAMINSPLTSLPENAWRSYQECFRSTHVAHYFTKGQFSYFPELFLITYCGAIALTYIVEHMHCRLVAAVFEQFRLFNNEIFDYVVDHWKRLEVQQIFLVFWITKLAGVVLAGPAVFPIDASVIELLSRATDDNGVHLKHSLNFTFLSTYAVEKDFSSSDSLAYTIFSRLLTGFLAVGAETWTSVFGAAVTVGILSSFTVSILAFFVDPLGVNIAQLIQTAEAEPVAANPWIPIEEQLTNNEHIEVTAVELLSNTGWSCVVLFIFLAIQYDLPNLTSHQRVFCFTHLLIVMGFTCIYPVESLVKAILLRLGLPGEESPWLDHLIPLMFCVLMLGLSGCVFMYFPKWLSYLPHTGRGFSFLGSKDATTGFASYTGYAQRLRTYLCGGQLLLDVSCTLFEYALHQAHRKWPLWSGFARLLAASRLINIFVNYLISLLSVLVILWLILYESFGLCRLLILIVHISFVLYPATCRGLSWLRSQFLMGRSLAALVSPTEEQLAVHADDCPICYRGMTPADAKITQCGHIYHSACLQQWMKRRPFCPMCNTDLFTVSRTAPKPVEAIEAELPPEVAQNGGM